MVRFVPLENNERINPVTMDVAIVIEGEAHKPKIKLKGHCDKTRKEGD